MYSFLDYIGQTCVQNLAVYICALYDNILRGTITCYTALQAIHQGHEMPLLERSKRNEQIELKTAKETVCRIHILYPIPY